MKLHSNIIYLIAVGFFSILGQVVILRELNVAFYGIELIYILSFAFWLLGTAIGAAVGRRSYVPKEATIHLIFLLSAILLIIDIIFIRGIRNLFGGVRGGYLPFTTQMIGLLIVLFPIGLLNGLLFQWSAKRFVVDNETLAKAYAIESAGGVIGALCSALFLDFGISNFSIAILCSLCFIFIVIYYSFKTTSKLIKSISIIAALVFLILLGSSNRIDLIMTSWNHPYLIESIDTPYNRVTITAPEKQICVFEDDVLSYETQTISAEEFVQMSTLQAINCDDVLVLGGGFEGIIEELLKLPVKKIDYVEINKNLVEAVQKYLPDELNKALQDKRTNIVYNDPRKFLQQKRSYDIILIGMPEPMSAQTNRFYTKEFFKQCANSLNDKGILAFKIQSSENIWTEQLTKRNAGIYNAIKSSFRSVIVLPGVVNIFIASKSKLTTDTNLLSKSFNERNLETKLVSPQYIDYIYTNDRFREVQKLISNNSNVINSDLYPICFSYTISIWLSKFFPNIAFSETPLLTISKAGKSTLLYVLIILSIALIVIIRKSVLIKRFTLVFVAGFIGMTLEIILILLYQNKDGILFRDIGLLIMAFMVGLTLGSFLINKLFELKKDKIKNHTWLGSLLFISLSLFIFLVYFLVKHDLMSSLPIISAAILFDGMLVSGIFSFISLYKVTNQQIVITQLYTSDLLGGCLGSLVASLLLIPIFGFLFSLLLLIMLSVCCIIYANL